MKKFVVTTDSGCDLPLNLCQKNEVTPVCLKYSIDGELGTDSMIDEQTIEFYKKMRAGKKPMTSSANIGEYVEMWEPLAKEGKKILHIAMSSGISNTCQNALIARNSILETYPDAVIEVIDSLMASLGMGMLVLKACEFRDQGVEINEAASWLKENALKVNTLYTTSDLTYLCRGGRISKAAMIIGTALGINPVMRVSTQGKLFVSDKKHGKKKTINFLVETVKNLVINPEEQTLCISHSDNLEGAKELAEAIMEEVKFKDVMYTFIGTTIGSHTGPGLKSIFFYGKEREM